jgi:hypothetical protein
MEESKHSGYKYHRQIVPLDGYDDPHVDVYAVLWAFDVRSPGLQHAVKKLLCAGQRGKASYLQDLREAIDCVSAEIRHQEQAKVRHPF